MKPGPATQLPSRGTPPVLVRMGLVCGIVAGPLFIATFVAVGAVRTGYDPWRHPVSSLALGPYGWIQTANFVLTGILYLVFTVGLWSGPGSWVHPRLGTVLVGAAAVGLVGAGVFPTDPISGYPPGTPDRLTGYSSPGALLHDVFSAPLFLGLPVAALSWAHALRRRGSRGWALYSVCSAAAMFVIFVLASAGFAQTPALVDYGGLLQRVSVIIGMGWLTAVAVGVLRVQEPVAFRGLEQSLSTDEVPDG